MKHLRHSFLAGFASMLLLIALQTASAESEFSPLFQDRIKGSAEIPEEFPDMKQAPPEARKKFHTSINEMLTDLYGGSSSLETNSPAERITAKATVLALFGEYQQAEDLLKQAIKVDPEFTMAHYNLACTYALQGKIERSTRSLENALKRNPTKYVTMANQDDDFQKIRNDNRFKALLKRYSNP